jgi:predicted RNA-binding protein with PIN domain
MQEYIIDAHNVIHTNSQFRNQISQGIDAARMALLNAIESYAQDYPSYTFTVVFDGRNAGIGSAYRMIKVQYSNNKSADELIKKRIRKLSGNRNVIIVSSDTEIHNFARINAMQVESATQFAQKILSGKRKNSTVGKSAKYKAEKYLNEKPNSVSKREIEEMKKLFGLN